MNFFNQFFIFNCLLVFIFGACVGSFINVIFYRFPKNQSIILPRSYCPKCESKIKWFDNIPIISWLCLSGNCRACSKKISTIYPIIELNTGLLFLFCFLSNLFINTNNTSLIYLIGSWILVSTTLTMSLIDIFYFWLPKSLNYFCIFSGIFINFLIYSNNQNFLFLNNILSVFLGYFVFRLISYISKIIYKKEALGLGDVLFIANIGAWNGFIGLLLSLKISFILAGLYVSIGLLTRKINYKDYIPLGPFLSIGSVFVWCIGKQNIMLFLN